MPVEGGVGFLPFLAARDWGKKNPDLEGNDGGKPEVCKECGKPLGADDEKKYGKR